MKLCPNCKIIKPFSEYHKCRNRPNGICGYCKICTMAKHKAQYPIYKKRILEHSKLYSKTKRHNLSLEEYNKLVLKQNNKCAICNTSEPGRVDTRLCIDHDHLTGQIRGLLCHNCNKGLGNFKDNTDLLEQACKYLRRKK